MVQKTTKTLSLSVEICERLEEEANQSAAVERALRNEFDIDDN